MQPVLHFKNKKEVYFVKNYIFLLLILFSLILLLNNKKHKHKEHNHSEVKTKEVRTRVRKYLKVTSDQPIGPEDIKIRVNQGD